jgi:hypothetical protein
MGGKPTTLPTMNRILTLAAVLTACAVLAMGADNSKRLQQCESGGRSAAECRLLVLGR